MGLSLDTSNFLSNLVMRPHCRLGQDLNLHTVQKGTEALEVITGISVVRLEGGSNSDHSGAPLRYSPAADSMHLKPQM